MRPGSFTAATLSMSHGRKPRRSHASFSTFSARLPGLSFGPAIIRSGTRSEGRQPPVWQAFIRWRSDAGEIRPRHEAPGHLFEATETEELAVALEHINNTRCDAVLLGLPLRHVVEFYDGDLLIVQSRHNLTRLSARLARLEMKDIGF